ncbi:MAG: phosphoribosylglycinamide formyltransferase [Bacteroidetes bacterium]|nr:phosphoribosylglycinamide formyltransferase [Bacteroidota bacterium]
MNIAVFASGSGSNAQKIFERFEQHSHIKVALLVCNKPEAYVIDRAKNFGIPVLLVDKSSFSDENFLLPALKKHNIEFIVLAGFLWLIPAYLIKAYPNKMVNIHPALLPKYGGKGMHGAHVHNAVYENKEKESGISIHFVNEIYDSGEVIFQATCLVEGLQPEEIANEVLKLEHHHFPEVIEKLLSK